MFDKVTVSSHHSHGQDRLSCFVRVGSVNTTADKTRLFCLVLTQFRSVASLGAEAIYKLWSALSNVLTKLLTVTSLGLAVNAQSVNYESRDTFHKASFLISFHDLKSCMLCNVK